jgi:hypothetical protein
MPAWIRPQKNLLGGGWQSFTSFATSGMVPGPINGPGTTSPSVSGPGDFQLWSGAGRLDTIMVIQSQIISGLMNPVIFYDAAVATSGGPFILSGHKVIGQIPPYINVTSGQFVLSGNTNWTTSQVGFSNANTNVLPFTSGLCVALRSGQPAFSIGFSPELPTLQ